MTNYLDTKPHDYRKEAPEPPPKPKKEVPGNWFYFKRGLPIAGKAIVITAAMFAGMAIACVLVGGFGEAVVHTMDWKHRTCHWDHAWFRWMSMVTTPSIILAASFLFIATIGRDDCNKK